MVWAGLPAAGAALIGAVAAIAQVLDYLDGKTVLLLIATGIVLMVAPVGPLVRRGERAVPAGVAVVLCLLIAAGGAITGYGLRGGFVAGTPWVPGLTGEAGPRIPGAPPATGDPAAPSPAPASAGAVSAAPTAVALTDPSRRGETVVDDNGHLDVATTSVTVAGHPLTDAFRTYCSCAPNTAQEGTLVVALGGTYRSFTAVLGVDQTSRDPGRLDITMRDVATGRVLLQRTVDFTTAVPVTADVTGVQRAEFVVRGPLGGTTGVIGEPRVTG